MRRNQRFVYAHVAWMLATVLVLVLFDSLSYALVFVVSFVGLLVVMGVTSPVAVTPTWRSRLRWVVALSLLVFAALIIQRIRSLLLGVLS